MTSRRRLFTLMYRVGFAPWDGHPLPQALRELVEGPAALPASTALDLGCGTGDSSIYLAEHGWTVTGVDFVAKAVNKARAKAATRNATVTFHRADVTRLSGEGVGSNFDLIVDSGCLHGMSPEDRDAYVREVTAVAAPGARLLIVAFVPGSSFGVPGIEPDEVKERFANGWTIVSWGAEAAMDHNGKNPARQYLFQRGS